MKNIYSLVTALAVYLASGCTIMDGNAIVTGNARSPISADQVRFHRAPPGKYEEIAVVSASAGHDFRKDSSLLNAAIQRFKQEAAKVGANGVLMSEVNERDAPSVTTSHGTATAARGGTSVYASGNSTSVNRGDSYTLVYVG